MDKDEVKACIRALLSSTTISYRLNSLLYDFKNTSGFDLPLYGYNNPIDFLSTLRDTVELFGDPRNPEICLVESEKSAHITSLVDRQKPSSKSGLPHLINKGARIIIPNFNKNVGMFSAKDRFVRMNTKKDFKKQPNIRYRDNFIQGSSSTLNSSRESQISQDFQLSDSVKNCSSYSFPPPDNVYFQNSYSSNLWLNHDKTKSKEKLKIESNELEETDSCYFDDGESCYSTGEDSSLKNSSCPVLPSYSNVNDGMKNKLKKLITDFPDGLWCCDLPKLFHNKYNFMLDYREFGYTSLIQMVSELPDVFRCIRPGKEDWVLFDASVAPSAEEKKMMNLQLSGDIGNEIKMNLQKLLYTSSENSTNSGIGIGNILSLYQKMFGTSLDYQVLGFKDLKSLLETLDGTFLKLYGVNDKIIVMPVLKKNIQSPIKWEEAVPPITDDNDIFYELFPENVVGPEEGLLGLDLGRHIAVGQRIDVCVAEVWSPYKFYLQLNKFKDRLTKFMNDLQRFYNVYLNKYKMPDATIRPKQVCVGLYSPDPDYPEEWHRAEIIKVINQKTVSVNFVDYGTVTSLKKNQLRFLHRNFMSFPAQAFRAKLAGVAPLSDENKWPLPVSKKFLDLLLVPYVEAKIIEADIKNSFVSVILVDRCQSPELNINKKLVAENLARYSDSSILLKSTEESNTSIDLTNSSMQPVSLNSSGVSVQQKDNQNYKIPRVIDEFIDIVDLDKKNLTTGTLLRGQTSLKSSDKAETNSSHKQYCPSKSAEVSYEFDEVQDLVDTKTVKSTEEKSKTKSHTEIVAKAPNTASKSNETKTQSEKCTASLESLNSPCDIKPGTSKEISLNISPHENISASPKPKSAPPGLDARNSMLSLNQIQILMLEQQQEEIKKKINLLAVELLTTNLSVKEVALTNPELALRIATQMAEAYYTTMYSNSIPFYCVNSRSPTLPNLTTQNLMNGLMPTTTVFNTNINQNISATSSASNVVVVPDSNTLSPAPDKPPQSFDEILSSNMSTSTGSSNNQSTNANHQPKSDVYVEKRKVGDKEVHLVKLHNTIYFCAEEIIKLFTSFSNREIADRILLVKKANFEYKIISKKTDEEVLNVLKSYNLPEVFNKKKKKKLKVYLLESNKVITYLETLGANIKPHKAAFKELENKLA